MGAFLAILAALSILYSPAASAQTGANEQNFATSLTAVPTENLAVSPVALKPFATIEVLIAANDVRGGTGANFVVDWAATDEIAEPAVEALMVVGAGHYAFISQGRPIKIIKN
jgi:Protein of unknown function (DUF3124)